MKTYLITGCWERAGEVPIAWLTADTDEAALTACDKRVDEELDYGDEWTYKGWSQYEYFTFYALDQSGTLRRLEKP